MHKNKIKTLLILSIFFFFGINTAFATDCNFNNMPNMQFRDNNIYVKSLQETLNSSKDTQVSMYGDGSPGKESTYFGTATYKAVIKFQEKYRSEILTPVGITNGNGFVGSATKKQLEIVCLSTNQLSNSQTNTTLVNSVNQLAAAYNSLQKSYNNLLNSKKNNSNYYKKINTSTSTATQNNNNSSNTVSINQPTTTPAIPTINTNSKMQWGAYVGYNQTDLANFESLVGKEANIQAIFWGFDDTFPSLYKSTVGEKGKTLVIYWEPNFGYDNINNGSQDDYIRKFAEGAKSYGYPVLLSPFDEMNLNEEAWGYGNNNNNASKFLISWKKIRDIFNSVGANNVKFVITYNNVSIPDVSGNKFQDYYPGDNYVDYIGIDGFNFGNPWQNFSSVFDNTIKTLSTYNKPIYIMSTASAAGNNKAAWIIDGLGTQIKNYSNILGWIWFNQNKEQDWRINSDINSLAAFKSILP